MPSTLRPALSRTVAQSAYIYSLRSVTAGSMESARRAGINIATSAIARLAVTIAAIERASNAGTDSRKRLRAPPNHQNAMRRQ